MSLTRERALKRGWSSVIGAGRRTKRLGGQSILRTSDAQVNIKRINNHETSFVALGKLHTSGDESPESILSRIIRALVSSRREQFNFRTARYGKENSMDTIAHYTIDNLPVLSEDVLIHLNEIKRRAAIRKARWVDARRSDDEIVTSSNESREACLVNIELPRGVSIDLS